MSDENGFGVPAGWYPDPLGLPQMRWWDNHGWTEHTTQARAPIVIQETRLAWADDELPTRRERREREREENADSGAGNADAPTAEALLELEPPSSAEAPDTSAPAPETTRRPSHSNDAPHDLLPESALTGDPAQPGTSPAHPYTGQVPLQPGFQVGPGTGVIETTGVQSALNPNTTAAWLIALIPLVQLVATLLLISAAGRDGALAGVILGVWLAPYPLVIFLAIADRRSLRKAGYVKPASWLWAILTTPVYLIVRAIRIVLQAGNGFAPLLVWSALALLQVGSIVVVPGLLISTIPDTFTREAEQSITRDARVLGSEVTVACPNPPATMIDQEFTCTLNRMGSGENYTVTASLVRENGWIAWQVEDWGLYTLDG